MVSDAVPLRKAIAAYEQAVALDPSSASRGSTEPGRVSERIRVTNTR